MEGFPSGSATRKATGMRSLRTAMKSSPSLTQLEKACTQQQRPKMQQGRKEGREEGRKEGRKEGGRKEGRKERKKERNYNSQAKC